MSKIKTEEKISFYYNSTAPERYINSYKHYHSMYEIYYLEQGICHYLIEGKLFEMQKGDIVFIPKRFIHKTSYDDIHSRLLINCTDEYLENIKLTEAFVYRNEQYSEKIYNIFKNIEKEYLHTDKFSNSLIKGYMQQLLSIVYRSENKYHNTHLQNEYIQDILKMLEERYTEDITLSYISKQLMVSVEHLSRLFKKETGLGFNEYLSMLRLKKAEFLLKQNKDSTISEIAFLCGFNDSNYFCEKFKKVYGLSPLKFRKTFLV